MKLTIEITCENTNREQAIESIFLSLKYHVDGIIDPSTIVSHKTKWTDWTRSLSGSLTLTDNLP
jgi:hypothetical protein